MSENNQETALYESMNELIEKFKDNKDLVEFAEDIIHNLKQVYLYTDLDFKSSEEEEESVVENDEIIIMLLNQIKKLENICLNLVERKSKYITKIILEKKDRYAINNNSALNRKEKMKAREVCNYTINQLDSLINFEYERIGYIKRRIGEIKEFIQELKTLFNH